MKGNLFLGEEFRDCENHVGMLFGGDFAAFTHCVSLCDGLAQVAERIVADNVGKECGRELRDDIGRVKFFVVTGVDERAELYERISLGGGEIDVYVLSLMS